MTAQAGDTLPPHGRRQPPGDPGVAVAVRKNELRTSLRKRRLAIGQAQARHCERRAATHLLRWRRLSRARHIAVYLSVRSELATAALIARLLRRGKTLWVPFTGVSPRLRFVPLRRGTKLRRGPFGLRQPARGRPCRQVRRMDVVLLPLLGFDTSGNRIGSGGGYYDRTLAAPRPGWRPSLIGYAYAAQELPAIPAEPWDLRLDAVVTEKGLHRFF